MKNMLFEKRKSSKEKLLHEGSENNEVLLDEQKKRDTKFFGNHVRRAERRP